MGKGAPDYTHLRQILARDVLGNLLPVACDLSGRIIMLPYGHTIVEQSDAARVMQGLADVGLREIVVDSQGRLIMLPYGWDGTNYRVLKVDDEGRMIGVMKGQADVKWGLRAWWKFVASEQTTIKDYSGYNNNGDAFSGGAPQAKYEDGVIGQCLEFDGADDYIDIADATELRIIADLTIEAWIYVHDLTSNVTIVGKDRIHEYNLFINTAGAVRFQHGDGAAESLALSSPGVIMVNTWYHVMVVRNTITTKVYGYVNSVLHLSPDYVKTPTAGVHNVEVGRRPVSEDQFFDGLLDEVRIYGRALSQDEVNWRYANTNPAVGKPTRMIAVDSEGRMEVNLKDLPYKDQVLERFQLICSPAGNYNLQSSVVPQGKLWVINVCNAYVDTAAIDTIDIGIYDGSDNFIVAYEYGTGLVGWVNIQTPLILKAGDRVNAGYVAVGNNGVINLVLNGYELDAP